MFNGLLRAVGYRPVPVQPPETNAPEISNADAEAGEVLLHAPADHSEQSGASAADSSDVRAYHESWALVGGGGLNQEAVVAATSGVAGLGVTSASTVELTAGATTATAASGETKEAKEAKEPGEAVAESGEKSWWNPKAVLEIWVPDGKGGGVLKRVSGIRTDQDFWNVATPEGISQEDFKKGWEELADWGQSAVDVAVMNVTQVAYEVQMIEQLRPRVAEVLAGLMLSEPESESELESEPESEPEMEFEPELGPEPELGADEPPAAPAVIHAHAQEAHEQVRESLAQSIDAMSSSAHVADAPNEDQPATAGR